MAAGATYTPIATTTASGSTTSVTFSSIPTTYTDLIIIGHLKWVTAGQTCYMQVGNGSVDTGNKYSLTVLTGNGTSATSTRRSATANGLFAQYANIGSASNYGTDIVQILNYSNTTTYKTWLTRSNDADQTVEAGVCLFQSTVAIDTIKIYTTGVNNIASGSTFTIYGVTAA